MISRNRSAPEFSGATKKVATSFQHILVPVDGSQLSEEAIPTAVALAQKVGEAGKITLLRVKQFDPTFYPPENAYGLPKGVYPELEGYLNNLATRIKVQGVEVETFASYGDPAMTIVAIAEERTCDVIVMVTHGRKGGSRLLHGSVADRVLQGASVPVLLLKHGEQPKRTFDPLNHPRLLVPLDGSELAEAILPLATQLALQLDAPVTLLRSLDLPDLTGANYGRFATGSDAIKAMIPTERQNARTYLEKMQQQMQARGIPTAMLVTEGGAAEDIARQASQLQEAGEAVFIVMATHGRTGLGRWLYGSVAGALLQLATTPMLVIRSR
ncbi:MAG TPA: universal stress protein [Ktedonobacterales bacterium]|jgi:nucleotide-binding universal stress UspA family protein